MNPERCRRIEELFHAACEREPEQRVAFLAEACRGDEELRRDVESLLEAETGSDQVLRPVWDVANLVKRLGLRIPIYGQTTELLATDEGLGCELGSGRPSSTVGGARPEDSMAGRQVGVYKLVRRIGQGGMAVVFLGERADGEFHHQVAVKLVKPGLDDCEVVNRFRIERQTLAGMDHPNIVKLLDGGSTLEGLPYLVMDYVDGSPIDEYCDRHKLSLDERLHLFGKVCEAVQYAHQKLIVHRDLKPSNILVTADRIPKLLDFGIAKVLGSTRTSLVTQTGTRCMTPAYASPEQVRGKIVGPATDIYSLGVVLYELLTGHSPYRLKERTPAQIERAICEQEPETPSAAVNRVNSEMGSDGTTVIKTDELVSSNRGVAPERLRRRLRGDLDNIVLKALQKTPERRYASVDAFARDVGRHLQHLPVSARRITLTYRASKLVQRHRSEISAALIFVMFLVAGIWLGLRTFGPHERRSRAPIGRVLTRITSDGGAIMGDISKDGKTLAYSLAGANDNAGNIWIRPIFGGSPFRVTSEPGGVNALAFSPDGSHIAYSASTGPVDSDSGNHTEQIFEISILGGQRRLLVSDGSMPRYSPDGSAIFYLDRNSDLWSVLTQGGAPRHLLPGFRVDSYAISPDGGQVLFKGVRESDSRREAYHWWLLAIRHGKVTATLPPHGTASEPYLPDINAWVRDFDPAGQEWIIYGCPTGDSYNLFRSAVSSHGRFVSDSERLTFTTGIASWARVASNGVMIFSGGTGVRNLWRIPIEANSAKGIGGREPLTRDENGGPAVVSMARDGQKVVYEKMNDAALWRSDPTAIFSRDLVTGHEQRLTDGEWPSISPDGSFVAFVSLIRGLHRAVYKVPADGGTPRKICEAPGIMGLKGFSSDGRYLLYQSWASDVAQARVGRIDLTNGEAKEVLSDPKHSLWHAYYSPDDKWITFKMQLDNIHHQLYITRVADFIPVGQKHWIPLTSGRYWDDKPQLSPNGNTLYFVSNRDGFNCIWAQKLNSSTKHPIGVPFPIEHLHSQRDVPFGDHPIIWIDLFVAKDMLMTTLTEFHSDIWKLSLAR